MPITLGQVARYTRYPLYSWTLNRGGQGYERLVAKCAVDLTPPHTPQHYAGLFDAHVALAYFTRDTGQVLYGVSAHVHDWEEWWGNERVFVLVCGGTHRPRRDEP